MEVMKEKREELEELKTDIYVLTAKCTEIIPQNTDDSRVINQALLKLSTQINNMHLKTFDEEVL